MRRRKQTPLSVGPDARGRVSISLTPAEARLVEAAAGHEAPASWVRWAALSMAERVTGAAQP